MLDLSGIAGLKTQSLSISPFGVKPGVIELVISAKKKKTEILFECSACGETFEDLEEIVCQCMICRRNLPVSSLLTIVEIPIVCTECFKAMKGLGTSEPETEYVAMAVKYIKINEEIKFKTLQSVISNISIV
jgi:hypothetical protein